MHLENACETCFSTAVFNINITLPNLALQVRVSVLNFFSDADRSHHDSWTSLDVHIQSWQFTRLEHVCNAFLVRFYDTRFETRWFAFVSFSKYPIKLYHSKSVWNVYFSQFKRNCLNQSITLFTFASDVDNAKIVIQHKPITSNYPRTRLKQPYYCGSHITFTVFVHF